MGNLSFNLIQITPLSISSVSQLLTLTNYDTVASSDVGIYITSTSWIDPLDYPANYPPDTDYNDLLAWGTNRYNEETLFGGLYISIGDNEYLVRYGYGDKLETKIPIPNIEAGAALEISIRFETPEGEEARRFLVDINVE